MANLKSAAAKRELRPKNPVQSTAHTGTPIAKPSEKSKSMNRAGNEFSFTGMSRMVKRMK